MQQHDGEGAITIFLRRGGGFSVDIDCSKGVNDGVSRSRQGGGYR